MTWLWAFLLLLGPLVVIHELGHFLVAKLFGVKCERFAVGFGPPIFRYRYGETEYVLAWLPLGGYVKMLGDSPDEELPPEERRRSFSGQSPLRRTLIALAGPGANLVLSVVVIAGVLMTIGWPTLPADIGTVLPDGPAARAGMQSGDRVVAIGGEEVWRWTQIQERVVGSGGETLEIQVERDGQRRTLEVTPEPRENAGYAIGVTAYVEKPVLVFGSDDAPGVAAGLRTGDRVVALDGKPIRDALSLESALEDASGTLELVVERRVGESLERVPVKVEAAEEGAATLRELGALEVDFAIDGMLVGSAAGKAGLESGDILLEVAGQRIRSFEDVKEQVQASRGKPISVEVLRDGRRIDAQVTPSLVQGLPPGDPPRWELGIRPGPPRPEIRDVRERVTNPLVALQRGASETWYMFVKTVDGVRMLVTREVGLDAVSGPIGIGQIAADAFEQPGWFLFLQIMALISVNLAIINLLPVPILDGGHILFAAAEAISGGPLGQRSMEMAQRFGLSFILLLMGFAFWNDIARNWQAITSFFKSLL